MTPGATGRVRVSRLDPSARPAAALVRAADEEVVAGEGGGVTGRGVGVRQRRGARGGRDGEGGSGGGKEGEQA